MKTAKIFAPFGLIFLPSVNGVQVFANVLAFQSIAPLYLRKFEFNAFIQNGAGTTGKSIDVLNVSLIGNGISFQSPIMQSVGLSVQQLDYTTTFQHVSEQYNPPILINPAEGGTSNIQLDFSIINAAAYVIGDALTWTAKFYFEEITGEQGKTFDPEKFNDNIDLGAFYPEQ